MALLVLSCLALAAGVHAKTVPYTLNVQGWVVDYQRASITPRINPHDINIDVKMEAVLANNMLPGPTIEAALGDIIEVTVVNNLIDYQINIDFEGVQVVKQPK